MIRIVAWACLALCVTGCKGHPRSPTGAAPAVVAPMPEPADPFVTPAVPTAPSPAPVVDQVALGEGYGCAVLHDHTVRCWGINPTGQLGDGTTTDHRLPLPVTALTDVARVAVGSGHSCAVHTDHTVHCWGANGSGQLGDGTQGEHDLPHAVVGITDAIDVAVGGTHTCVVRRSGAVACWGRNVSGQLGDGSTTDRLVPTPVRGVGNVSGLALGGDVSCVRRGDGTVLCWGADPTGHTRTTATPVPPLARAAHLVVSQRMACVQRTDGTVACVGPMPALNAPDLARFRGADEIALSTGSRATFVNGLPGAPTFSTLLCGRWRDGTVRCGGDGAHGQLGSGTPASAPIADVAGVGRATALSVGGESLAAQTAGQCGAACSLGAGGALLCWGCNEQGMLGDGTLNDRAVPTALDWPRSSAALE